MNSSVDNVCSSSVIAASLAIASTVVKHETTGTEKESFYTGGSIQFNSVRQQQSQSLESSESQDFQLPSRSIPEKNKKSIAKSKQRTINTPPSQEELLSSPAIKLLQKIQSLQLENLLLPSEVVEGEKNSNPGKVSNPEDVAWATAFFILRREQENKQKEAQGIVQENKRYSVQHAKVVEYLAWFNKTYGKSVQRSAILRRLHFFFRVEFLISLINSVAPLWEPYKEELKQAEIKAKQIKSIGKAEQALFDVFSKIADKISKNLEGDELYKIAYLQCLFPIFSLADFNKSESLNQKPPSTLHGLVQKRKGKIEHQKKIESAIRNLNNQRSSTRISTAGNDLQEEMLNLDFLETIRLADGTLRKQLILSPVLKELQDIRSIRLESLILPIEVDAEISDVEISRNKQLSDSADVALVAVLFLLNNKFSNVEQQDESIDDKESQLKKHLAWFNRTYRKKVQPAAVYRYLQLPKLLNRLRELINEQDVHLLGLHKEKLQQAEKEAKQIKSIDRARDRILSAFQEVVIDVAKNLTADDIRNIPFLKNLISKLLSKPLEWPHDLISKIHDANVPHWMRYLSKQIIAQDEEPSSSSISRSKRLKKRRYPHETNHDIVLSQTWTSTTTSDEISSSSSSRRKNKPQKRQIFNEIEPVANKKKDFDGNAVKLEPMDPLPLPNLPIENNDANNRIDFQDFILTGDYPLDLTMPEETVNSNVQKQDLIAGRDYPLDLTQRNN